MSAMTGQVNAFGGARRARHMLASGGIEPTCVNITMPALVSTHALACNHAGVSSQALQSTSLDLLIGSRFCSRQIAPQRTG